MSIRAVRKFFSRKPRPEAASNDRPKPPLETDWCGDIIKVTTIIANASDLTPFPYIKSAANILVALLEPLQQLQKNKDDFRELAEEICKLLIMLRDRLLQYKTSGSIIPMEFGQVCTDFAQCLVNIQSDMKDIMQQQSVRMRAYFKAGVVKNLLSRYKAQVESLRLNFIMLNIFDMRVQLADIRGLLDSQDDDTTLVEQKVTQGPAAPANHLDLDTISDYKQISVGDLQVITEPIVRHRGVGDDTNDTHTEDLVVKCENVTKTLRIYRGRDHLETLKHDFNIKCKLRCATRTCTYYFSDNACLDIRISRNCLVFVRHVIFPV
ncbi:hypothetical protein M378DRAFT_188020 [Amanita muscaria Koide BX008]|uniref:Uncharacterized protein n=1 Tax=Amanita muscaria (strain Koide BX008) TaxID=946122 RepID=A0A0C2S8X0_AMAMK|nr:hypothetical protein M378DRAFT_188020 [Amanita muscaria Koide BX008]